MSYFYPSCTNLMCIITKKYLKLQCMHINAFKKHHPQYIAKLNQQNKIDIIKTTYKKEIYLIRLIVIEILSK